MTDIKKIKFAVIGTGHIGKRHIEMISRHGESELVALCDIKPQDTLSIENYKVPFFNTLNELMQSGIEFDVLSIATPNGLHAEHALIGLEHKKHIVIEKPMALTLADADRMIAACDVAGSKLFVIKQNRFNVPVVKLRQALEAGRFGKLVMGSVRVRWCRPQAYYDQDSWRGTWALDGGVLTNQASHHVDMLEWMMGDVESVFAMSRTALVKIETEDTAVVMLRFTNGALGVIEATTAARPKDLEGSISILGEGGTVVIGGFAVNEINTWNFGKTETGDDEVLKKFSVNPPNVYGFGHQAYYEHAVSCILNNTHQLVDGLAGRKSLELISAIYESIETGKEVSLRFKPTRCKLGQRRG